MRARDVAFEIGFAAADVAAVAKQADKEALCLLLLASLLLVG